MFLAASSFTPTVVGVETYQGEGGRGPVFAASTPATVFLSDSRKLVRDQGGTEVISESTVFGDPADAALFTPGSRVALPNRKARVITVKTNAIGDPDVDHFAAALT
jgi:hypothetical protein